MFVCMGNICRSPLAEGVFRAEVYLAGLQERIEIASAGTGSWHVDEPPHKNSQAVALERGFSIADLRGRKIVKEDFAAFDYIVAMDRRNVADLQAIAPQGLAWKVTLLMSFAADAGSDADVEDVPDPYGMPIELYRETLNLCEAGARGLLTAIRQTDLA
jgi:protein-tyrosine phosphatase